MLGMELRGKQLGLVGLGRIGRAVAEKAPAFGMRVAYTTEPPADLPGATPMPLDRLLATSDVVSLHVPMTPETRHLIDQKALTQMKRTGYLINTSRGPVVDEEELAWALRGTAHRRRGARRLRERASGPSRPADARERAADTAPGQRHDRDAHGDGRSGGLERPRGARRPAAADARSAVGPGPFAVFSTREWLLPHVKDCEGAGPKPCGGRARDADARTAIDGMELPAIEKISEAEHDDPFQVLIATLLSARTQDATTHAASTRLFRARRHRKRWPG